MAFTIIIPARYASQRFPGKPLATHDGRSLLSYTYERACAAGAQRVVVATDHEGIAEEAQRFHAEVIMTSPDHLSGTDRLTEVVQLLGMADDEVVVNWQGDEPLLPVAVVQQLAEAMAAHPGLQVATLSTPITHPDELRDPHAVKVVVDQQGMALYFSRAPVPWDRDGWAQQGALSGPNSVSPCHQRHIGLYAYRVGFLKRFSAWDPAPIERLEALEQLRILWHGDRIRVVPACEVVPPGVDTPADWAHTQAVLSEECGV